MSEDRRWTAENWAAGANPRAVVQALEASASTGSTHAPAACSSFRVYANLVRTEVTEDFDDTCCAVPGPIIGNCLFPAIRGRIQSAAAQLREIDVTTKDADR